MAKKKTFLLVSLEESKARKLAQVISNDTCRKILDYLSKKEATETELSSQLNIPISTVHYNLQQLVNSGLAAAEEFHYSEKGKEVLHYSLANKYIIIAPKTTESLANRLRHVLPIALFTGATAGVLHLISQFYVGGSRAFVAMEAGLGKAVPMAEAMPAAQPINPALWFLYGAIFALLVYVVYEIIKYKREIRL